MLFWTSRLTVLTNTTFNKLHIFTWNCSTLTHKLHSIISFVNTHDIDILIINETRLKPTDRLNIRGYTTLRQDRPLTNGVASGGVAMLIKSSIAHHRQPTIRTGIENITVKLMNNLYVCGIYNPPSNKFTTDDLNDLARHKDKLIIAGDFNAAHTMWDCGYDNGNGRTLWDFVVNTEFMSHTDEPTHYPNTGATPTVIDLFLHRGIDNLRDIKVIDEMDSDHIPVSATLTHKREIPPEKKVFDYAQTDWDMFRVHMNRLTTINNKLYTTDELEAQVVRYSR